MADIRDDGLVVSLPGERFTPFTAAKKLGAVAILESASFKKGRERYSIIQLDEAFRIRQKAEGVFWELHGKESPWPDSSVRDILDVLAQIARQNQHTAPDLPVPGAGIGFLGYDFVRRCDKVHLAERPDPIAVPEAEFIVGHLYLIIDHYTDIMHLVGLNYAEHQIDLEKRIAEIRRRLDDLDFTYLEKATEPAPFEVVSDDSLEERTFKEGVRSIHDHIVAGDLLQAVLSRRLTGRSGL